MAVQEGARREPIGSPGLGASTGSETSGGTKATALAFGGGLVFALAALGIVATTARAVPAAVSSKPSAERTSAATELDSVSSLRPSLQTPPNAPAQLPAPAPAHPATPASSQESPAAGQEMGFTSSAEAQAFLEGLVFQETADRGWAPGAETMLSKAFQAVMPASARVEKLERKSTLCRVDLNTGPEDAETFIRALADERPWRAPIHLTAPVRDASGRITRSAYIAREGHPLPGLAD